MYLSACECVGHPVSACRRYTVVTITDEFVSTIPLLTTQDYAPRLSDVAFEDCVAARFATCVMHVVSNHIGTEAFFFDYYPGRLAALAEPSLRESVMAQFKTDVHAFFWAKASKL